MSKNSIIGVDLGGTKVAVAKITGEKVVQAIKEPIPAQSSNPQDILDVIANAVESVMDSQVMGIGMGIPGLVDRDKGVVYDLQNIPSWKEIPLKKIFERQFGVPVFLDNDANCFALGERYFGLGRETDDFVGITLGTGMGSGIVKNGMLLPDAHCGSGEFGNIPYRSSIYEDYCSGKFFIKKFNLPGEELLASARHNDPVALKAFDEFGYHLGNAIKTILLAVDPQKVIIGGSVARSHPFFKNSMWRSILDFPFQSALHNFDVLFSEMSNIAVLGAASLYLDKKKNGLVEIQNVEFN